MKYREQNKQADKHHLVEGLVHSISECIVCLSFVVVLYASV